MCIRDSTNNVRVVLQHISGEAVDKDRFVFTITGTNGSMDWDNTLLPDEMCIRDSCCLGR